MKMSKTKLAVELSTILTSSATDAAHLVLIKERQGNMAEKVQAFLKCGLDRKDLIFAITEALQDAEPIYIDQTHKGTCQKNRRMFSAAWSKVFEGFTLKISGKVGIPTVLEEAKAQADPYKKYEAAVKRLEDILLPDQIAALSGLTAKAIEDDKARLAEAIKTEVKRDKDVQKRKLVLLEEQVTASFIVLGVMEPSREQIKRGVAALQAQG